VARLTGEYVLDHHSASQCDPIYDLASGGWADEWAAEVADGVALPRLVWPMEVVGRVTDRGAASSLPEGVAVMAGTVDAWAEAFSVGVRSPGDLMLMYESTIFMIGVTASPIRHAKLWTTAGVAPGTSCLAAGMATSGSVIEWVRELAGGVAIQDLVTEAADTAPGADGLLLLPYFAGERSPLFDPDARGVLVGLTLSHRRSHLARAAYEATAFGVRHNLETIAATGWQAERIVAVGGGATRCSSRCAAPPWWSMPLMMCPPSRRCRGLVVLFGSSLTGQAASCSGAGWSSRARRSCSLARVNAHANGLAICS
jgi:xylulokinase